MLDPKRVVADGYDQMGDRFSAWISERPDGARRWFLDEVLARLGPRSAVLELGCGPGTDAAELSAGRRYLGVDLSSVQLSLARKRVPGASFVVGDLASMVFRPASFDVVVAMYVFMHVPQQQLGAVFERIFEWLRPGGRLMLSLPTIEAEQRFEEWLGVPMFFARFTPRMSERLLGDTGFHLEMSEVRGEGVDDGYGPVEFHWVIARKPAGDVSPSSNAQGSRTASTSPPSLRSVRNQGRGQERQHRADGPEDGQRLV